MLQKFQRNLRPTTLLMFFGFVISLTSILEGVSLINSVIGNSCASSGYAFSSQAQVSITGSTEQKWDITSILQDVDGIAMCDGVLMYLDDTEIGQISWSVLLNDKTEDLKYPLKWGRLPTLGNDEVVIPDSFEKFAKTNGNSSTIKVQGKTLRVVGVFDTTSNESEELFLIGYQSLPQEIHEEYLSLIHI